MNISKIFIMRPIATALLMIAIILSGLVAFRQLPVAALPQVDYPTIQVVTFYPGAGPEVMVSSVTAPLEKQFGQIPGLSQMTSSSTQGCSVITLRFVLDLDIDIAVQQVQAAINVAGNFLPRELPNPPIYSKVNPADAPVLTLSLSSSTIPLPKIQDLADTRLAQKLSQVKGVGQVTVTGGQKPAIRVQANPTSLAAMGLTLDDLRTALIAANVNQARREYQASSLARYDSERFAQHPTSARSQHHRGGRSHSSHDAAASRSTPCRSSGRCPNRPYHDHPSLRRKRPA